MRKAWNNQELDHAWRKYAPFPVPSSVIKQRTENVVKTKAFCSPFSFGFSQDFGLQIWPKLPSRPFFRMCPPPHPRCVTCEGDYFSVTYSWTNTWQGVIYHFFLGFFCGFLFVFVLVFVFSGGGVGKGFIKTLITSLCFSLLWVHTNCGHHNESSCDVWLTCIKSCLWECLLTREAHKVDYPGKFLDIP